MKRHNEGLYDHARLAPSFTVSCVTNFRSFATRCPCCFSFLYCSKLLVDYRYTWHIQLNPSTNTQYTSTNRVVSTITPSHQHTTWDSGPTSAPSSPAYCLPAVTSRHTPIRAAASSSCVTLLQYLHLSVTIPVYHFHSMHQPIHSPLVPLTNLPALCFRAHPTTSSTSQEPALSLAPLPTPPRRLLLVAHLILLLRYFRKLH